MIGFVNGEIEFIGDDQVLIDCGFMGYNIFVPGNVIDSCRIGDEIKLYTYMNVREDAINLFGFLTSDELNVFKKLITVNGIGPKGALAILTIMSEDSKLISRAPGIGVKTAQKVILELKDKLDIETIGDYSADGLSRSTVSISSDIVEEAIEALTALGYSNSESTKAVKASDLSGCTSAEDIIKQALKNI